MSLSETLTRAGDDMAASSGPCAPHTGLRFTGADALATWLAGCADKIERAEFVIPPMDGTPDTLYLWLNEVEFNPDRWFLSPMAFAWADRGEEIEVGEVFDGAVGHEVADVRAGTFTLEGLEPLQEVIAGASDAGAAGRWVVTSAMALVDEVLRRAPDLGLRVALSRSDEPLIAVWERDGGELSCVVHAEGAPWE